MKNLKTNNIIIRITIYSLFAFFIAIIINHFYIDLLAWPGNFLTPILISILFLVISIDFSFVMFRVLNIKPSPKFNFSFSIFIFLVILFAYTILLFLSYGASAIVLLSTVGVFFYSLQLLFPLLILSSFLINKIINIKLLRSFYSKEAKWFKIMIVMVSTLSIIVSFYALFIEPYNIEVTHHNYEFESKGESLRIVHLTDIQTDYLSKREKETVKIVNNLDPDIIVLTGDYYNGNLDQHPEAYRGARYVLEKINAKYGIFAVSSDSTRYTDHEILFEELEVTYLKNESYNLKTQNFELFIVGIDRHREDIDKAFRNVPKNSNTLVLYHGPEMYFDETFKRYNPDLLLVGHTHGGQIALPIIGPLTSATKYGRKYAKGWFSEFGTDMYVNRGLGMDGWGGPKIRFLSRPEVAVIEASL